MYITFDFKSINQQPSVLSAVVLCSNFFSMLCVYVKVGVVFWNMQRGKGAIWRLEGW